MKNIPEIGINLNDSPDSLIRQITGFLEDACKVDIQRIVVALGNIGKSIVPLLHEIICTETGHVRLEALKVVKYIADKRSIPMLIYLLDDEESRIRWIAAEALVNIGRSSILPLLKSIRDRKNPTYLYRGAHHVLKSLLYADEREKIKPLLHSLDNHSQLGGISAALAFKALETTFKPNL
jgi:HEAT repeat protein